MSVADVTSAITDIQSRLAALSAAVQSADGGASFAAALSGAASSGSTTGATGTSATSATAATGTSASGVTGDDVVQAALQYKGVPYVLGGESKSGIDCSGLVQASFKDLGISVPRLVHEQQTIGQKVDSLKDAKPGDLIVLNGGNHIAIWAGNDTVIHAPYPGRTVSVQKAWFDDHDVVTIRRVVPATDGSSTSTATSSTGVPGVDGTTSASAATSTSGVSAAALSRAVALLGMYGTSSDGSSDDGLSSSSSSSSTSSLSSLLSSLGATSGSTGSSSTAQQLLAARTALMGASS